VSFERGGGGRRGIESRGAVKTVLEIGEEMVVITGKE
jgi:hypothetical protein